MDLYNEIRRSLYAWYDMSACRRMLFVGDGQDFAWPRHISAACVSWEQLSTGDVAENNFDLVLADCGFEKLEKAMQAVANLYNYLASDGHLLLAMNNRMGFRYFCGDKDPYTGQVFDSIDGYRIAYGKQADIFKGRMYGVGEVRSWLLESGFNSVQFYSVLSDLTHPAFLFREDFLPNEDLAGRVFPFYNQPESVFLEEENLYPSLIANGLFHQMANAYLVECSPDGSLSGVQHVTCSAERGEEHGVYTIIRDGSMVEKKPVSPSGERMLKALQDNMDELSAHGVKVVPSEFADGCLRMPFVKAPVGTLYLKNLLLQDREKFLQAMDHFAELILHSSEHVKEDDGDGEGVLLRKGYFDMVPLNSFTENGDFVFFDQEFALDNYPANVILTRFVDITYGSDKEMQKLLPRERLYDRYGLTKHLGRWIRMSDEFLSHLRNLGSLHEVYAPHQRDSLRVYANRQRINYSEEDYQRLFVDIFSGLEDRKLAVFGSGNWAQRFIDGFGSEHPVSLIVDNKEDNWGKKLRGISIVSPEELKRWPSGSFKVLICIKGYQSVMHQLENMGITDYSIFDPNRSYPRKPRNVIIPQVREETTDAGEEKPQAKKYHIGYIAGVFDLFHIGHLNMFRRAKEQCDYLIVGVVSDEGVRKNKGVDPFVPFEERLEIVRSCRYVDEANEIPLTYAGTREAWNLYHFDVQFSGSDYENNPYWLDEKDFLEKHGATLVFFPYTEKTSSTKIKALIKQKLL
ncbi:adenylyltransferase/cytidyltransferase family protein [Schwartzia succinivorans]|uniref:adenylyltransferase/cytidyltransferase family protein n=1 Tax=Schwartzia succinivorans TaxID=55507 RepID=UPI0023578A20|nr:adenylyltransferase/cytidyltransferase family protein [Schwartzia succinivorans]